MLYLKLLQLLALHWFRVEGGLNDGFGDLVVPQLLEGNSVDLTLLVAHGSISLLQHRLQDERLHARIAVLNKGLSQRRGEKQGEKG